MSVIIFIVFLFINIVSVAGTIAGVIIGYKIGFNKSAGKEEPVKFNKPSKGKSTVYRLNEQGEHVDEDGNVLPD